MKSKNIDYTLRREFVINENIKDVPNYKEMVIVTNYRNIFYNTCDTLDITPNELSLMLWAYPYRFFSRKAIKDRLRMSPSTAYKTLNILEEKGYVKEYSSRQIIEDEIFRQSEVCDYIETVDVTLPSRFSLTYHGKRVCHRIFKEISQGIIAGYPYDTRVDMERYKFL